jgi:hypothetical protein
MSLADRAAELARPTDRPAESTPTADPAPAAPFELADTHIPEPGPEGPERVPVHVAWSRVMATVGAVGKDQGGTSGINYKFRGVDMALNVFGPACRLHGVLVLPVNVAASYRDAKTSTGKATRECTVLVTYRIVGPAGDHLDVMAAGESLDSGDKGSAKAQAVALRTLLFHAGLVPVEDPDSGQQHERGEANVRNASSYRDEAVHPATSLQRLQQMYRELTEHRMVGALVVNETGDDEPIGQLVARVGKERRAAEGTES